MTSHQTIDERGFRGYIVSRPVRGVAYPHKIQNLVIRDYCQRKGLLYLLSATEGSVPNSFMMLNAVLDQLADVRGIVLFSQFTLPAEQKARRAIYDRVLAENAELHAAFEENVVAKSADIDAFEAPLVIQPWLGATPFKGKFPALSLDERAAFEI